MESSLEKKGYRHAGSNRFLDAKSAEQKGAEISYKIKTITEMCLLGINYLFIGIGSLGTPNDSASRSTLFETTSRMETTPITVLPL